MNQKQQPNWFGPWKEAGFIRPESARRWMIYGFKPEIAAPWYNLDSVEIHIASEWLKAGFTADEYTAWLNAGFRSARLASEWAQYFCDPVTAAQWRSTGLSMDKFCRELLDKGLPPEIVLNADISYRGMDKDEVLFWFGEFSDLTLFVDEEFRDWMNSGLSPDEIKFWLNDDVSLADVIKLRGRGWSQDEVCELISEWGSDVPAVILNDQDVAPRIALGWTNLGLLPGVSLTWISGKFSPESAQSWVSIGVTTPQQAQEWMRAGCQVEDAEEFRIRDWDDPGSIARFSQEGWAIADVLGFLRLGVRRDVLFVWVANRYVGRDRWARFFNATYRRGDLLEWYATEIPIDQWPTWICQLSGEARVCGRWFKTGLPPTTIVEKLQVAGCSPLDFDANLSGMMLASALESRVQVVLTRKVPVERRKAPKAESRLSSNGLLEPHLAKVVSDSQVEEFQARAIYLSDFIRKVPIVGLEFFDAERGIRICIEDVGEFICVKVDLGKESFLVKFDAENFDPASRVSSVKQRISYILAIGWFLDCAVSYRSGARRMTSNFQEALSQPAKSGIRQAAAVTRYVPTISFTTALREIRGGSGVSPVLHEVSGHIRHLPPGWSPSKDAVRRAPAFLRRKMGPGDTFVIGHRRGKAKDVEEYVTKLSQYSMTAHAIDEVLT